MKSHMHAHGYTNYNNIMALLQYIMITYTNTIKKVYTTYNPNWELNNETCNKKQGQSFFELDS